MPVADVERHDLVALRILSRDYTEARQRVAAMRSEITLLEQELAEAWDALAASQLRLLAEGVELGDVMTECGRNASDEQAVEAFKTELGDFVFRMLNRQAA